MTIGEVIELVKAIFAELMKIFDSLFGNDEENGETGENTPEEV